MVHKRGDLVNFFNKFIGDDGPRLAVMPGLWIVDERGKTWQQDTEQHHTYEAYRQNDQEPEWRPSDPERKRDRGEDDSYYGYTNGCKSVGHGRKPREHASAAVQHGRKADNSVSPNLEILRHKKPASQPHRSTGLGAFLWHGDGSRH